MEPLEYKAISMQGSDQLAKIGKTIQQKVLQYTGF